MVEATKGYPGGEVQLRRRMEWSTEALEWHEPVRRVTRLIMCYSYATPVFQAH